MIRRKNKHLSIFFLLLSMVALPLSFSCEEKSGRQDKIGVVVSILPLCDFVQQIGKNKVEVTIMVPPGGSPHSYEPKPDQLKQVSRAKMFVKVGSGVEFELAWMDKLAQLNEDMRIIDSSQGIELMGKDPHIWLSPTNAKKMVENICDGLVELDPKNSEYYKENLNHYLAELSQIDGNIRERLEGIEDRRFIAYHPAWGYFARDYDLEQISVQHAGKEPTAEQIRDVVKKAKAFENKVVFVSPQLATKGAETIAKEIGGFTVFIDPLPQSYIPNMRAVVGQLVQAMR
jgi:zinc transport system substrate-binding protein